MVTAVPVGVLFDMELGPLRAQMTAGFRAGLDVVGWEREIEIIEVQVDGLPHGTEHALRSGFMELERAGVVAIVGPGITDNAFVARDLADAVGVPCLNWSGNEQTRSRWCFQFQVGPLEEEPLLLVDHLVARDLRRVALVHDESAIGRRYAEWFQRRRARAGLDVVALATLPPVATDATAAVESLAAAGADVLVYLGLGVAAHPLAEAMRDAGWDVPAVANTALMHGYSHPDWTGAWEGWTYVDMTADTNPSLIELRTRVGPEITATPLGACFHDMGHVVGSALAGADVLTRAGVLAGLEATKQLPATCGRPGTSMTLGHWDRGVLKGPYLTLRQWRDGRSVDYAG